MIDTNDFLLNHYQSLALRTTSRDQRVYRVPESVHDALRDYLGDGEGADQAALEPVYAAFDQMTWSLGLTGEAGEFADMMKKHHGHNHDLDKEKAAKELGDVMWYVAVLANSLGYKLSEIADMNIQKLIKRYPNGFSVDESKNRKDLHGDFPGRGSGSKL